MKKYFLSFLIAGLLSLPAQATTLSLMPDQNPGDTLHIMATDTSINDFVSFAIIGSGPSPYFNILSNTKFNGQTLSQTLTPYALSSYVDSSVAALVNSAPSSLNTFGEVAGAIGNDPDFAATIASAMAGKVDKVTGKGLSTEDYTSAEKSKLAGIASGATANDTDANLKARANHTGTQAISTVSGLQTALDGKANTAHGHAIADVTGLQSALDAKFSTPSGTTSQYVRGDGSLATYSAGPASTDALTEGSINLYFTGNRARAAAQMYSETTQKLGAFPIIKSVAVSGGTATFHLTANGASGGTALYPNGPDKNSVQVNVNDSAASYQLSWAWSNSDKTLTVTCNYYTTANILTGLLGQSACPNTKNVNLVVFGN